MFVFELVEVVFWVMDLVVFVVFFWLLIGNLIVWSSIFIGIILVRGIRIFIRRLCFGYWVCFMGLWIGICRGFVVYVFLY